MESDIFKRLIESEEILYIYKDIENTRAKNIKSITLKRRTYEYKILEHGILEIWT